MNGDIFIELLERRQEAFPMVLHTQLYIHFTLNISLSISVTLHPYPLPTTLRDSALFFRSCKYSNQHCPSCSVSPGARSCLCVLLYAICTSRLRD